MAKGAAAAKATKFSSGQRVKIDAKHGKWGEDNSAEVVRYKRSGMVLVKVPDIDRPVGFQEADLVEA